MFTVEQFLAEYKLDHDRLKAIYQDWSLSKDQSLVDEWRRLWPEGPSEPCQEIPKTWSKPIYFLQSPKDDKTNPIVHYSLDEIMLADLQDKRNMNKRLMSQAFKAGDKDNGKRYNAMQLALKVISNSTYGASNNAFFAHYDPDIAAAITKASRLCIAQLTHVLETDHVFVDQRFIDDNKQDIELLNGLITFEETDMKPDRRSTLRRMYNERYELISKPILMHKPVCRVVYQDTDSNYFECPRVQEIYLGTSNHDPNNEAENAKFRCSPEILNQMMNMMVRLDNFLCEVTVLVIGRNPIGLGFEGSFFCCRYLNRKKMYFGIKAADDDGNVYPYRLCDDAYVDGVLRQDYDQYWKPGKQAIPRSDGAFVVVDDKRLLDPDTNYNDYVADMNVKVTGVDLTRRDKYRFVKYYHVNVLSHDMRICKYVNGEWVGIPLTTPITEVINNVIDSFKSCISRYQDIANLRSDVKPEPYFTLNDFMKNARNDPDSDNDVKSIVRRYEETIRQLEAIRDDRPTLQNDTTKECLKMVTDDHTIDDEIIRLKSYIPYIGDRLFYVVCSNDETERRDTLGQKALVALTNIKRSVPELIDNVRREWPTQRFDEAKGALNLTYDQFIDAVCISRLYFKHYLYILCKAMTLYIIGEEHPDIARAIDEGEVDADTGRNMISMAQKQIADRLVERYYPSRTRTNVHEVKISVPTFGKSELNPSIAFFGEMLKRSNLIKDFVWDPSKLGYYRFKLERLQQIWTREIEDCDSVYLKLVHDRFTVPSYPMGSRKAEIYRQFDEDSLGRRIKAVQKKLDDIAHMLLLIQSV